jgi:hypothetical protein
VELSTVLRVQAILPWSYEASTMKMKMKDEDKDDDER